jgi:hypothetical protein
MSLSLVILCAVMAPVMESVASTLENQEALQERFIEIKRSVITAIESVPEHPEILDSGAVVQTIETAANVDLTNLLGQIQQQTQIIREKEQGLIKNANLSQAEKEELKLELQKQSKPLQSFKEKVSQFKDAVNELRETRLRTWKETYKSFKDIYGEPKATEKLKGLTDSFCAPYALPKQPPVQSVRTVPASSAMTPEPVVYQYTIQMPSGVPSTLRGGAQIPDFQPTIDSIPFRTEEIPINNGVIKSIRPADGSISITLLNRSQEKKKVSFKILILNRQGVVLSESGVSWIFKRLEPGAEAVVDTTFKCHEPQELKYSTCHAIFDMNPAWIVLRGADGNESPDGGGVAGIKRNKKEEKHIQSTIAATQPAVQDLFAVSEDIAVGRGILRRISMSQGRVNVTVENSSTEKKPIKFHIYFLNGNGIIIGDQSVTWYFKQLEPGARSIESFTPTLKAPEELRHSIYSGMDATPQWILIRNGDDSPYQG